MNSVIALILALVTAFIGYRYYAKHIDQNVIKVDPKKATPAKMYMDGVDFIPTGRHVLFGYQFKSIAALGPVLGPIIALKWGWLPGLAWILLGTLFFGWVQDYSSAMLAMRNDGQSFGALAYRLISPRGRVILLSFIYFYLILIVAAFGAIASNMMVKVVSVPFAILALMVVGILAGWMIYKKKIDILITTVIMVILALVGIWLGTILKMPFTFDILVLGTLVFCYLGAVLPIWSFTQPINYISFYLVALGMIGAALGVLIGHPVIEAPMFTGWTAGVDPLWPILFVTIACGAISGWHSLVSSSGTARQLENETDTRYVAAGSMFTEMFLATLALLMGGAAVSAAKYGELMKGPGPAGVFAAGMSGLLAYLGIPQDFGTAFAGAMFVILAITVMQLVVRFARIATAELLGNAIPLFKNIHVGAILTLLIAYLLIKSNTWGFIWVLFGGSNQLMAALALLLVSIWLASEKRNYGFAFYPMLFMLVTTIAALGYTGVGVYKKMLAGQTALVRGGNAVALAIDVFLIIAALFLAYDGLRVFTRVRSVGLGAPAAAARESKQA